MTLSCRVRSASVTHSGLVRSVNEDSLLARDSSGVWVVADGMGGHANGQWASSTVISAIAATPLTGQFEADLARVTSAVESANARIFRAATEAGARMGSTAAALYVQGDQFACIWVGDSRIYLLRDGQLKRMTRDHTQVRELVERGLLAPEEAVNHPMSHVLSRGVGVMADVELERVLGRVRPQDVFLLCSDGLSGVVSDDEIADHLALVSGEEACGRLLDLVLSRSAPDNVTMIVVACGETAVDLSSPAQ